MPIDRESRCPSVVGFTDRRDTELIPILAGELGHERLGAIGVPGLTGDVADPLAVDRDRACRLDAAAINRGRRDDAGAGGIDHRDERVAVVGRVEREVPGRGRPGDVDRAVRGERDALRCVRAFAPEQGRESERRSVVRELGHERIYPTASGCLDRPHERKVGGERVTRENGLACGVEDDSRQAARARAAEVRHPSQGRSVRAEPGHEDIVEPSAAIDASRDVRAAVARDR